MHNNSQQFDPPQINSSQYNSRNRLSIIHISSWLLGLGLLLTGIGGAFLPWIWRDEVALQLTGPGLAEFVKFLPEVRTMQLEFERLFFLLPLFLAILAMPLFAVNKGLALPTWLRRLLRLAVFPLALASLSPVWAPPILLAPEFRLQTSLALAAMGGAVIAPVLKNLPPKLLVVFWTASGPAAIILPLWQFSLIRPGLAEVYQQPVGLGWGWWVTAGGLALGLGGGVMAAFLVRLNGANRIGREPG
ncbi:MAG: hypothetical protein JW953_05670 [Anaerolineae bacterium]|nr:hypothetical protein [Anaerolineae bacterium]